MRRMLLMLVLAGLAAGGAVWAGGLSGGTPAAGAGRAEVEWHRDFFAAHRTAVAQDRPLVVVFGASWCTWCKRLETQTLRHPAVAGELSEGFVAVALDFDRERRLAEILEVRSLPCSVVLSPEADLLARVEGHQEPEAFRRTLGTAQALRSRIRGVEHRQQH